MEQLTDLKIYHIGENEDEWQIVFTFDDTEERISFYRGATIKMVVGSLLSFVKSIVSYWTTE